MRNLQPRLPRTLALAALSVSVGISAISSAAAGSAQDRMIARYALEAKARDSGFREFSAARGGAFFLARPATGKPDTPSCTSCHTDQPSMTGRTRAGKDIAPMALSKTADRYSDPKKVEKWFLRNCRSVLGRLCSAREKGDFLTFMTGQ